MQHVLSTSYPHSHSGSAGHFSSVVVKCPTCTFVFIVLFKSFAFLQQIKRLLSSSLDHKMCGERFCSESSSQSLQWKDGKQLSPNWLSPNSKRDRYLDGYCPSHCSSHVPAAIQHRPYDLCSAPRCLAAYMVKQIKEIFTDLLVFNLLENAFVQCGPTRTMVCPESVLTSMLALFHLFLLVLSAWQFQHYLKGLSIICSMDSWLPPSFFCQT